MNSSQVRQKYLNFFKKRDHAVIPAAPLVPADDPTTLFTGSGMQQLVPYLKGQPHPMGKRLVDSQPSFRAEDIEEVGDNRHTTFFEMLGNWSLGDYFKKEQLPWFFEFLTQEVGLDPRRLYVTVFAGNRSISKDEESIKIWQELFKTKAPAQPGEEGFDPKTKIYLYDAAKNWWSRAGVPVNMPIGEIGGPDSEVFYDFDPDEKLKIHEKSPFTNKQCHINCDCGRFLEIGNSVFMQYEKIEEGLFKPLPKKNVDFGGGLERFVAASENQVDIFKTDLFWPIIEEIEKSTSKKYEGKNKIPMRIIADHLKAAVFMTKGGLEPDNKKQGYVMRRLIRRAVVKMKQLDIVPLKVLPSICQRVIEIYGNLYFDKQAYEIHPVIGEEIESFERTIHRGTKLLQTGEIDGRLLFDLYQTYGFPLEISKELLSEWGRPITSKIEKDFENEKQKHQNLSRTASVGMFKGGLADHSETITKLHTATHLLHQALRKVLGDHVHQEGSNITAERLRFDFTHPKALTPEEIKKVEALVNQKIKEDLPVHKTVEDKDKALESGALAFFREKYPDKVSVYTIGKDVKKDWFSKELCGGPHVTSTGKIGGVTIVKEAAVGAGKRRIYAELKK